MGKLKKVIGRVIGAVVDSVTGAGAPPQEQHGEGAEIPSPGQRALLRRAAAEGAVLLKNDGVLPFCKDTPFALFGRTQNDWFYGGMGSGGGVHTPYKVSLAEALRNGGAVMDGEIFSAYRAFSEKNEPDVGFWGSWHFSNPETVLKTEEVIAAAGRCATAVVVIGRGAGEEKDLSLSGGSYLLSRAERALIETVTEHFEKTVLLLNVSSLIDLSFISEKEDRFSAVLLLWAGGMESGNAAADLLYGRVNPSGRLPDTAAKSAADYPGIYGFHKGRFTDYSEGIYVGYRHFDAYAPERVLYGFGYGLSYTSFETRGEPPERNGREVRFSLCVKNVGKRAGKNAVLVFCRPPRGQTDKPVKTLAAFGKTSELAPGCEEKISLDADVKTLAYFDEAKCAFILEKGRYVFEVDGKEIGSLTLDEDETVERCTPLLHAKAGIRERVLSSLPRELPPYEEKKLHFSEVLSGAATVENFVSQLEERQLEALTRGHGMMNSPLGAPGNAGVFGGVTKELRQKGVPPVTCCDGPAGLRMSARTLLLPCASCLAASFDTETVRRLYMLVGSEMERLGADILLGPGMNIHRNPLCGRNFEYFSEDPLLSGKIAAAAVLGVQSAGKGACPKHFACNNREKGRKYHDARLSERALREIYLRAFEICVKEAHPVTLMTSYNKVNGVWSQYSYDLCTTVLRSEWGFEGAVMTDWWTKKASSPHFRGLKNNALRVRAQNDLLMPGSWSYLAGDYRPDRSLLPALRKKDGLKKSEIQRAAANVLRVVCRLKGGKAGKNGEK